MSNHDQLLPFASKLFRSPSESASRPSTFRVRCSLEADAARHPARHAPRPVSRPRRAEPRRHETRVVAVEHDPVSIANLAGVAILILTFASAVLFL